ncbi:MAG: hypothetical protein QOE69_3410 [Thermoleophilaceae bacterium]|jgi:hypothetical protein|nr:hypothetical protein [Thermoleophilaceae bacterium]MEA2409291.1 hypothetical protein [Thermoleophilaceae bacterium]
MLARVNRTLFVAVVTATALLGAALTGNAELVAYAAPLCALGLPLLAGRYLGEDALERLRERRSRPRRARIAVARLGAVRRVAEAFPRGGRLIAQGLAERGPPVGALT